jgi:hypothetical protein
MTARFPNDDNDNSSWEDENSVAPGTLIWHHWSWQAAKQPFRLVCYPWLQFPPSTPISETGAISTALNAECSPAAHVKQCALESDRSGRTEDAIEMSET